MEKTEILNPIKNFLCTCQGKVLDSHRYVLEGLGTFSTFTGAILVWYYFIRQPNKFHFEGINFDNNRIAMQNTRKALGQLSSHDKSKARVHERTLAGDQSRPNTCSECVVGCRESKDLIVNHNWSETCCSLYSDEEMERLARKYDDHYKKFLENPGTVDFSKEQEQISETVAEQKHRETLNPVPISAPCENVEKTNKIPTENPNRAHQHKKNIKKLPKSQSIFTAYNYGKRDIEKIVEERIKREKERQSKMEKKRKEREEMLEKIKEERKRRMALVRKAREELIRRDFEKKERRKQQKIMRGGKKSKQLPKTQSSCTIFGQNQIKVRKSNAIVNRLCHRPYTADTKQIDLEQFEVYSPPESNHHLFTGEVVCSKCRQSQLGSYLCKDAGSLANGNIFTDEKLIIKTSKAFEKLIEVVKVYEEDNAPGEEQAFGRELYLHCKNELQKYKSLVEELKMLKKNRSQHPPVNDRHQVPTKLSKFESVLHKNNIQMPVAEEFVNSLEN